MLSLLVRALPRLLQHRSNPLPVLILVKVLRRTEMSLWMHLFNRCARCRKMQLVWVARRRPHPSYLLIPLRKARPPRKNAAQVSQMSPDRSVGTLSQMTPARPSSKKQCLIFRTARNVTAMMKDYRIPHLGHLNCRSPKESIQMLAAQRSVLARINSANLILTMGNTIRPFPTSVLAQNSGTTLELTMVKTARQAEM
jgi:hypothetical protein